MAAIHVESWKDSYSADLPAEFLAAKIDRDLAQHWSEIKIQREDIALVAEEDSLVGFVAVWCRPMPFIDKSLHGADRLTALPRSEEPDTAALRTLPVNPAPRRLEPRKE
jgi:hypothetical protein